MSIKLRNYLHLPLHTCKLTLLYCVVVGPIVYFITGRKVGSFQYEIKFKKISEDRKVTFKTIDERSFCRNSNICSLEFNL